MEERVESIEINCCASKKEKIIEMLRNKKVIIYGAGYFGKNVLNALKIRGVIPIAFWDKEKCGEINGIPIYKPFEFLGVDKNEIFVLLSMCLNTVLLNELIDKINENGFNNLLFIPWFLDIGDKEINEVHENINQIKRVYDFLEDERSRKILESTLNAHITCDYLNLELDESLTKYFKLDFNLNKGYKCLIDCGAYVGDSFEMISDNNECQHYIGFGPDLQNFIQLSKNCKDNKDKVKNITIYPMGVGNINGFYNFESGKDTSSKITQTGNEYVQITRLDDILITEVPTFIKMDIEGAEVDALKGAQELIKKYKPDLAICVYHKISDLWEIPLLIKSFVPEYKLYLRSHEVATLETVLYATVE